MLHNKRARVLIIVLGLVCAAVLATVLGTRGLATQGVAVPNVAAYTVQGGTSRNIAIPLNTPVFIGAAGKSYASGYGTATRTDWVVVCCDGTYWNWIGGGLVGYVRKGNKVQYAGSPILIVGHGSMTVKAYNNSGGLTLSCGISASQPGPMYVYIHW
jgi:hypothetical protein